MLTDIDRKILAHVSKYGFITISQATAMYYPLQRFGYDQARRRLNSLVNTDYLKVFRNYDTNQKVFHDKQVKKVSLHSMLVMDYYAKLVNSGADILEFTKEKEWASGEIRSDAFIKFKFDGYTFYQFLEVYVSDNDIYKNIEKYEKLFVTREVQNIYNIDDEYYPTLIVIDDVEHKKPLQLQRVKVVVLDFNLSDFSKIFI
jgi:hypothetical protein